MKFFILLTRWLKKRQKALVRQRPLAKPFVSFLISGLVILIPVFAWCSERAVTYQLSHGRFGDSIQGYLHAKWISYRYQIPLLYKPFLHSREFALHEFETPWSEEKEKSFDHVITYSKEEDLTSSVEGSVLYVIPFFSEILEDRLYHPYWIYFPVDWKDPGFVSLLRASFSSLIGYPVIESPQDFLRVALHVRRGGGADPPDAHLLFPLRFLPDSYYLESLRKISALFPHRPIYAHIFTDELEPSKIVEKYQRELSDLPITFGCRIEGNRPTAHILEDFLAMMKFDCLIRTKSNYSLIPAVVGDYQVVITPEHYTICVYNENNTFTVENYIDQIDIKTNGSAHQKR
jgi:hypothetical protein